MFDLTEEQLNEVKRILFIHVPECKIYVFGSRAKGTNKPYSDLDIAIDCGEEIKFSRMTHLLDAFENSELPFRVDVVDWTIITDEFKKLSCITEEITL